MSCRGGFALVPLRFGSHSLIEEEALTGSESSPVVWQKSRASSDSGGNCVEVAIIGEAVLVRNSQDPSGPVLSFSHAEWRAFLTGARNGEFNFPEGA
jgi:hypothetical protein